MTTTTSYLGRVRREHAVIALAVVVPLLWYHAIYGGHSRIFESTSAPHECVCHCTCPQATCPTVEQPRQQQQHPQQEEQHPPPPPPPPPPAHGPPQTPEDWVQPSPVPSKFGPTDPLFHITWDDYISTSGNLRVTSVGKDHRSFPESVNGRDWEDYSFPSLLRQPFANLFQIHAAYFGFTNLLRRVDMWIYTPAGLPLPQLPEHQPMLPGSGQVDASGKFHVTKVDPTCRMREPYGGKWRREVGTRNSDLIVRCIAYLTPKVIDQALCRGVYNQTDCKVGHFVIHETTGGTLHFPLDRVMHFPDLVPMLKLPSTAPRAFPKAPWRADGQEPQMIRATGEQAKVRTCAWVPKKFSWDSTDEVWLHWMLDVVGVDFVAINLVNAESTGYENATQQLLHTTNAKAVRKSLAAHPELNERVLIISSDIPGSMTTFEHMVEGMHWDAFVRLQADCEYGFSLDTDEYVDLFESQEPYGRVDVQTFIAQHEEEFNLYHHVYMSRAQMKRVSMPGEEDTSMPPFLTRWLQYDSPKRTQLAARLSSNRLGKSLFEFKGSVQPYLHYLENNLHDFDDFHVSRMLHVRLEVGFTAFSSGESGSYFPRPIDMR